MTNSSFRKRHFDWKVATYRARDHTCARKRSTPPHHRKARMPCPTISDNTQ